MVNFAGTLTAYNFGQNGQNEKFLGPYRTILPFSHDVDIAGKDGGRVQLHQDGQEDIRKTPFYGQIAPIWPVSMVFSAASAYQSTGMGVVSVGEGQGKDRVDMGSWQKLFPLFAGGKPSF